MTQESFVLYSTFRDSAALLSLEDRGRLWDAVFSYQCDGALPNDMPREVAIVFAGMRPLFDRDKQRYRGVCEARREAGRKGGLAKQANANSGQAKQANASGGKQNRQVLASVADLSCIDLSCIKEKERHFVSKESCAFDPTTLPGFQKSEGNRAKAKSTFTKPSLKEVAAYCKERGNTVDPARFINYYQSNGWRVGKNPMRDWHAAVHTWETSEIGKPKSRNFDL